MAVASEDMSLETNLCLEKSFFGSNENPACRNVHFFFLGVMGISTVISTPHPRAPSDASEERLSISLPQGSEVAYFIWDAENLREWFSPRTWHTASVPREFDKWMKNQGFCGRLCFPKLASANPILY